MTRPASLRSGSAWWLAVGFALTLGGSRAMAATEQEQAIAKGLFDKGVKLMTDNVCAPELEEQPPDTPMKDEAQCLQARDNFKRAYELVGSLGALRNLAFIEKRLGLVASAARHFRDLVREAPKDPRPAFQKFAPRAKAEAEALEPRVPHLTVKVLDKTPGTKITLDGEPLKEAAWNTPLDVDPGKHSVHAEAPGRLNFEGSVTIAEKQDKSIAVVLEVDASPSADKKAPSKVGPIVTTGVGVVGLGVGLTFGYLAIKKKGDECPGGVCKTQSSIDDGRSLAGISTIVTAVGGAVLVGGIIWWVLTPSAEPSKDKASLVVPWVSRDGAGLAGFVRF